MAQPPVIFSPRFFRLLWLILRERFRPLNDATGSRAAKGGMRYPDPGTEPHDFPDDTDATPDRAAKMAGLRDDLEDEMDAALRGVWAEYPRECEEALDAVMKVIERRFGDA